MKNKNSAAKKEAKKRASLDALYKDMQQSQNQPAASGSGQAAKGRSGAAKKSSRAAGRNAQQAQRSGQARPAQQNAQAQRNPQQAQAKSANAPRQQANPQQQRAVNKAVNRAVNKNRSRQKKKRGSRGGNYALYYIFAGTVAVIVFAILAKTVLFDCSSIVVEGNARYTAEEIIQKSGIKTGTSLLDINTEAATNGIVGSLAYIDSAQVRKSYPTKIEITVQEAERWFIVQDGSHSYIVSRMGKIIDEAADSSLPVVFGYEAKDAAVGAMLLSDEDGKTKLPELIMSAAEAAKLEGITSIDISDRFEIVVLVEDRVTLNLGLSAQLENKLHIARELIRSEIAATEYVTVNLTNPEKVYVRDNNIIDNPVEVPVLLPEETAESGESGEPTAEA